MQAENERIIAEMQESIRGIEEDYKAAIDELEV